MDAIRSLSTVALCVLVLWALLVVLQCIAIAWQHRASAYKSRRRADFQTPASRQSPAFRPATPPTNQENTHV